MMPRTANISGRSRRLSLYRRRQSTTRAMTSGDDIGRILGPVQQGAGALVELLATGAAAVPAIALGGVLGSLRHSLRSALQAPHLRPPLHERQPLYPTEILSARGSGTSPDRTPRGRSGPTVPG